MNNSNHQSPESKKGHGISWLFKFLSRQNRKAKAIEVDMTDNLDVGALCSSLKNYDILQARMKTEFLTLWDQCPRAVPGNLSHLEAIAVIGMGSFGRVKLYRNPDTKESFAVKIMRKEDIVRNRNVQKIFNEKRVLYSMRFPFLVNLQFARKDSDYIYLGMPFVAGGDLFNYHRKVKRFSEKQAKFYGAQVYLGLDYMHNVNLIYRDLKPENILLGLNGYIRITDFGFTKRVMERTTTLCGTPEYIAPEIIQSKPYGNSVDWWSFGILLYEFVAGYSPFSVGIKDPMTMYAKICDADYKIPQFFSHYLKDLIVNLLQVDLSKRYGHLAEGNKDIKNHYWFKSTDWCGILSQNIPAPYIPTVDAKGAANFEHYPDVPLAYSKVSQYGQFFKDF